MGSTYNIILALFVDYVLPVYYVEIHLVAPHPCRGSEFLLSTFFC